MSLKPNPEASLNSVVESEYTINLIIASSIATLAIGAFMVVCGIWDNMNIGNVAIGSTNVALGLGGFKYIDKKGVVKKTV